jgi:hypothetical protein
MGRDRGTRDFHDKALQGNQAMSQNTRKTARSGWDGTTSATRGESGAESGPPSRGRRSRTKRMKGEKGTSVKAGGARRGGGGEGGGEESRFQESVFLEAAGCERSRHLLQRTTNELPPNPTEPGPANDPTTRLIY